MKRDLDDTRIYDYDPIDDEPNRCEKCDRRCGNNYICCQCQSKEPPTLKDIEDAQKDYEDMKREEEYKRQKTEEEIASYFD
jgi:hypothetical protein